jgi:hypothetical protein
VGASEPDVAEAQCGARVIRDFATSLVHLKNFCPAKTAFNDGLIALMQGPSGLPGPRCNRLDGRLILHYLMAQGGTSLAPVSGDCVRNETVLFSLGF